MMAGTPDDKLRDKTRPEDKAGQSGLEDDVEAGNLEVGLDGLIRPLDDDEDDDSDSDRDSSHLDIGDEVDDLPGGDGDEDGPEKLDLADLLAPMDPLTATDDDTEGPNEELSLVEPEAIGEVDDDGTGANEATEEGLQPMPSLLELEADDSGEGPVGEEEDWSE